MPLSRVLADADSKVVANFVIADVFQRFVHCFAHYLTLHSTQIDVVLPRRIRHLHFLINKEMAWGRLHVSPL